MTDISHTGEQLLSLIRTWLQAAPAWQPAAPEPQALWGHVRRHGLDGMAGALVARGADIPEPLRQPAFAAYCTISLRSRQALALCHEIRDAARTAGLPLGFVKGPALTAAYGDDGVRGFGDIDVFVPDADAVRELSARCGLTLDRNTAAVPAQFWKRARSVGRIEAQGRHFVVEFTMGVEPASDALYELCHNWPERYLLPATAGEPLPVPAPEAHLLFLLQHLGLHWFNRLVWLADFAVLMRTGRFDAGWLEDAAARLEMRKLLRAVTGFCRRHLDESIRELGSGPVGWKDGLYLSMLAPEAFTRMAFFRYAHTPGSGVKDVVLGALQLCFDCDAERPILSRRHPAVRWLAAWLQYVLQPGGQAVRRLSWPVPPFLFVCMMVLVCVVFRRSPRGFARDARRRLAQPAGPWPATVPTPGVINPC